MSLSRPCSSLSSAKVLKDIPSFSLACYSPVIERQRSLVMRRLFVLVVLMLLPLVGVAGYGVQEYSEEMFASRMYPGRYSSSSTRRYPPESLADSLISDSAPGIDVSCEWDYYEGFDGAYRERGYRTLAVSILDRRVAYDNLMDFSSRGEEYAQLFQVGFWENSYKRHSEDDCGSYPFDHKVCRCLNGLLEGLSSRLLDGDIRVLDLYNPDDGLLITFPQYPGIEPLDVTEFFSGWIIGGVVASMSKIGFSGFFLRWYFDGESYFPVYNFRISGTNNNAGSNYEYLEVFVPPNWSSGQLEAWSQSLGDFFVSMGLPRDVNYRLIPGGDPVGVGFSSGSSWGVYYRR